jgi:hypothetical protein
MCFHTPVLSLILRILGVQALAQLGRRLSSPTARTISSLALIATNLLPILAVLHGSAGAGDVFVVYWLENVIMWAMAAVKIATASGRDAPEPGKPQVPDSLHVVGRIGLALFFTVHFGLFTLVHGVFTFILVGMTGGLHAGRGYWVVVIGAMLASHLLSLGLNWFGRGERTVVTAQGAMVMPYPRMIVLHVAVIGAFFLMARGLEGPFGGGAPADSTWPVVLLCVLKTAVDLALHLRERFASQRALAATG